MSGMIIFQAFNPYEARFSGRRVISRFALDLSKQLRSLGYQIKVEPDLGQPLEYYVQKGFGDVLSDPLLMKVVDLGVDVVVGVASAWLYDKLRQWRWETTTSEDSRIVIEADVRGNRVRIDHRGRNVTDERFETILAFMADRQRAYQAATSARPPTRDLPIPIFLEHTGKVVGWANITLGDRGLLVNPAEIVDDETWTRIRLGELQGFSVAGIVERSECSICGCSYADCTHITGQDYDGRNCTNRITSIHFCEVSVVAEPINPECLLQLRKKGDA